MSTSPTHAWHLVQTHSHCEAKATEHLHRQGFTTYLPRHIKHRSHARKVDVIAAPLFPRYLFVAIDCDNQRWSSIRSTRGVASLVSTGNAPARVPDQIITELREREDKSGFIHLTTRALFRPGQRVQVVQGAFSLCEGLFETMADKDRVAVLMEFMGRSVRVLLDEKALAAT